MTKLNISTIKTSNFMDHKTFKEMELEIESLRMERDEYKLQHKMLRKVLSKQKKEISKLKMPFFIFIYKYGLIGA